jgi:S-adenosylmethionine:tRNA ribosyltransferase-isomerase
MDVSDLDYSLPEGAIAQEPPARREDARLLVDRGAGSPPEHRTAADLPDLLRAGDILVVNDTRVLPARLLLHKATGGAVEVLLLERFDDDRWEALVRPSRLTRMNTSSRSSNRAGAKYSSAEARITNSCSPSPRSRPRWRRYSTRAVSK